MLWSELPSTIQGLFLWADLYPTIPTKMLWLQKKNWACFVTFYLSNDRWKSSCGRWNTFVWREAASYLKSRWRGCEQKGNFEGEQIILPGPCLWKIWRVGCDITILHSSFPIFSTAVTVQPHKSTQLNCWINRKMKKEWNYKWQLPIALVASGLIIFVVSQPTLCQQEITFIPNQSCATNWNVWLRRFGFSHTISRLVKFWFLFIFLRFVPISSQPFIKIFFWRSWFVFDSGVVATFFFFCWMVDSKHFFHFHHLQFFTCFWFFRRWHWLDSF